MKNIDGNLIQWIYLHSLFQSEKKAKNHNISVLLQESLGIYFLNESTSNP